MFKRSAQSSLNYAHATDTMHSGSNSRQNWSKKLQRGRHREKSGPRWSCEKRTPHTKPSSSSPFVITQPVHTALTYECITNDNDDPDGEEFDRPTTTATTTTTVWTWTQTGIQIIFHVIKSWERDGWCLLPAPGACQHARFATISRGGLSGCPPRVAQLQPPVGGVDKSHLLIANIF